MPVYSVLSFKGGAVKSTTTVQLAVWLSRNNSSVAIVDNDQQRSVKYWLKDHPAKLTIVETNNHKEMERAVYQLMDEKYDYVLVDNAGNDTLSMNIATKYSYRNLYRQNRNPYLINKYRDLD